MKRYVGKDIRYVVVDNGPPIYAFDMGDFISHSSADHEFCAELYSKMTDEGLRNTREGQHIGRRDGVVPDRTSKLFPVLLVFLALSRSLARKLRSPGRGARLASSRSIVASWR